MSRHRFFLESALPERDDARGVVLPLSASDRHHLSAALRIRPGEHIELVDAEGEVWVARVVAVDADTVNGVVIGMAERATRPGPRLVLVQGVAKGERMDAIVRQAVELGVDEIVPVLTERSVVRLSATKRTERAERWRRIARAAAEQSHRVRVPDVAEPCELRDALDRLEACERVIVLWEEASGAGVRGALGDPVGPEACVALVVGPEGGLSAAEVDALVAIGGRCASLGDLVLRTETAAIVGLALVAHELGYLGADLG